MMTMEAQLKFRALCPKSVGQWHMNHCMVFCCSSHPAWTNASKYLQCTLIHQLSKMSNSCENRFLILANFTTLPLRKICCSHRTETVYKLRDFHFVSLSIKKNCKGYLFFTVKDSWREMRYVPEIKLKKKNSV